MPLHAAQPLTLVVLGDSLTAGYLLPPDAAFPAQLEKALRARGLDVTVVNAGVSGDTASGGLERLDWSVPDNTDAVLVELGANDALRGLDPSIPRKALDTIVSRLKGKGIPVMLAGMYAPPNLGPEYGASFNAIYPELAAKYGVPLYPFFLEGVATVPKYQLQDRLHPNREGVAAIVAGILPQAEAFLRPLAKKP